MEPLWPRSRSDAAIASVRETLYELHKIAGTFPIVNTTARSANPLHTSNEEAYRVADNPALHHPAECCTVGPVDVYLSHADKEIEFAEYVAASLTSFSHRAYLSSKFINKENAQERSKPMPEVGHDQGGR